MNAKQAIDRSASHDEIVHIEYSAEDEATLAVECDDSVSANGVTEYWANDPESETKMLWRVHMRDAGTGYYGVDTGNGNELCSGLAPEIARKAAQAHADRLGESVYLYEVGSDDEAEEIAPSTEDA